MLYRIRRRIEKTAYWAKGWLRAYVLLPMHMLFRMPIRNVSAFQRKIPLIERHEYSQNGEDGILEAIFAMIGTTNRFGVEFGVEDGMECNMRYLLTRRGWTGLLMDGGHEDSSKCLRKEFITTENIEQLFAKHSVPKNFDLLSIDIDGNDYWVWKAIINYRPRVVVIEYNAQIAPEESKTVPYDPNFRWDKTDYYGASLAALKKLGDQKGYTLLCTDKHGVNAFFVLNELVAGRVVPDPWPAAYHPPAYKGKPGNRHPADPMHRPWVTI